MKSRIANWLERLLLGLLDRMQRRGHERFAPSALRRVDQQGNERVNDRYRRQGAQIGRNVRIMGTIDPVNPHLVSIGDNSVIGGQSALLAHGPTKLGQPVCIGKNVYIGFGAIVLPGVTIGDNCLIGAGSVVTRDIPPNSIAAGNPARVLRPRDPEELAATVRALEEHRYIGAVLPEGYAADGRQEGRA